MSEHRGTTLLGDGSRVPKSDARFAAIAHCDDASASMGLALALGGHLAEPLVKLLAGIQNDLLDVSADLNTPVGRNQDGGSTAHIDTDYIERLQYLVDYYSQDLDEPAQVVLPGGTASAALIHKARASVRLAEVRAWEAIDAHGDSVNVHAAEYLNELDHLLLVLGRAANAEHGDTYWVPGLSATQSAEAAEAVEAANSGSSLGSGSDTTAA